MGSRLLRLGGLLAAASLLVVGCAGDADEIDESESPLTVPPPTSESPTADAALDLETMTDEELLAEAERAYQGWLDDMEALRESGSTDYLTLDTWATESFRAETHLVMEGNIDDGHVLKNAPSIIWIELSTEQPKPSEEVLANVCVDNTKIEEFDEEGDVVDRSAVSEVGHGTVRFVLSEESDHFLVAAEMRIEEGSDRPCSVDS